jgi:hypothetical protein
MKKKKKILIIIVVALFFAVAGFFGGIQYGKSGTSKRDNNIPMGGRGTSTMTQRMGGNNMIGGEIISKDNNSITVKLQDGGSKIIFFSTSTRVMKSLDGTLSDLTIGEQIAANGTQNSDGSITAQSIQTRTGITPPRQ